MPHKGKRGIKSEEPVTANYKLFLSEISINPQVDKDHCRN